MNRQPKSFWLSLKGCAALGLIGAASYFLLVEHRQHLFEWLPFLIILACPLMHLFLHRGHGHDGHGRHGGEDRNEESVQAAYRRGLEDGKRETSHSHHHYH